MLAARRHRDGELSRSLLALWVVEEDAARWNRIVLGLGACGGAGARHSLRESFDAEAEDKADDESPVIWSSSDDVDERLLALLRLGEEAAIDWAVALVEANGVETAPNGMTFQGLGPTKCAIPEMLGKWRCLSAARLLQIADNPDLDLSFRLRAARGLCWQRDARGLHALVKLLTAETRSLMPTNLDAVQAALHDFVDDTDRPYHEPFGTWAALEGPRREVVEADPVPARVAARWQDWLKQRMGRVRWRIPPPDFEDDDLVLF
jgi:hypothetical protein